MIYALLSGAAIACNAVLGIYVFLKNPSKKINRWFGLLMLTLCVWQTGELLLRSVRDVESARAAVTVYGTGIAFLPSIFLYFSLLFPKEREVYTKSRFFILVFFVPPLSIIALHLAQPDIIVKELFMTWWGYTFTKGLLYPVFLAYFILFGGIAEANLLNVYLTTKDEITKKQSKFFLYGTAITFLVGSFTDVLAPVMRLPIMPTASMLTVFSDICIAYAILKYRLMMVYPAAELEEETVPRYQLERGRAYLLEEKKTEKAYDIFVDMVRHGVFGLCITRNFPKAIKKKYNLQKTPFLWLSGTGFPESMDPQDLGKMKHIITEFVSTSSDSVVLIEGFEYLLVQVGFDRLIKAVHAIVEIIILKDARLLVSLNPESFSEWEMSLLKKELHEIEG